MRRLISSVLCAGLVAASAQAAESMKASAPEKMMPAGQAEKMRACDAKAMDANIKMEDRAAFVRKCMAMK
jgi:serine protease inhibitor ecotin